MHNHHNHNRFFHPPPPPRDAELLKKATHLKIEIYSDKDGSTHGEWSLSGGWGMWGLQDCGDDAEAFARQQEAAGRFVTGLFREFNRKGKDKDGRGDEG